MGLLKDLFIKSSGGERKTYIDENGYRRFKDSGKYVHRWMAEKKLGRKLFPGEIVHHKNRKKWDNRPENLVVCNGQFNHHMRHAIRKILSGRW